MPEQYRFRFTFTAEVVANIDVTDLDLDDLDPADPDAIEERAYDAAAARATEHIETLGVYRNGIAVHGSIDGVEGH